jgi:hypothetical protein
MEPSSRSSVWPTSEPSTRLDSLRTISRHFDRVGGDEEKKDVNYDGRSRYMHENKQNRDKMTAQKSDIFGNWITVE